MLESTFYVDLLRAGVATRPRRKRCVFLQPTATGRWLRLWISLRDIDRRTDPGESRPTRSETVGLAFRSRRVVAARGCGRCSPVTALKISALEAVEVGGRGRGWPVGRSRRGLSLHQLRCRGRHDSFRCICVGRAAYLWGNNYYRFVPDRDDNTEKKMSMRLLDFVFIHCC